jgi:hypothetical protein
MLLGAVGQQRLGAVVDGDGIARDVHAGALQLLVDDELQFGVSLETPGPGPMRHHEARLRERQGRRLGIGLEPGPYRLAPGMVFARQFEIHDPTPQAAATEM